MIFKFSKQKVQDFIKVVQFMDKENIDYAVIGELGLSVGEDQPEFPQPPTPAGPIEDNDPLWRPTDCPEKCCDSRDKSKCKHICHYGAIELD